MISFLFSFPFPPQCCTYVLPLFVLDVIGHVVEKDTVREVVKDGVVMRLINIVLEDLQYLTSFDFTIILFWVNIICFPFLNSFQCF